MKKLISVIVPVYNVEKYLPRCIESILRQTYPYFELILVNDGSPDKSGKICDKYAKKDERIKVIHKENGGVSSARNAGLDCACGEYISFIDSDDWIREDYLEKLLAPMLQYDVQMVFGGMESRDIERVPLKTKMEEELIDIHMWGVKKLREFFFKKDTLSGPVCKLFLKSCLNENGLRFNERIALNEDAIFLLEYWSMVNKIYIINDCLYYYNKMVGTSSTHRVHPNQLECRKKLFDAFQIYIAHVQINEIEKQSLLLDYKVKTFVKGVRGIVLQPGDNPIKKIEDFYNCFTPWLIENCDKKDKIFQFLVEKNFNAIYEMFPPPQKVNFLKRMLRFIYNRIYVKCKIFFIERRRDGLKSYQKNGAK